MTSSPAEHYDQEPGGIASDVDALLGLDGDQELTADQIAALAALDGGFDPADLDPDELDAESQEEWLAVPPAALAPEVINAGFSHRDGGSLGERLEPPDR